MTQVYDYTKKIEFVKYLNLEGDLAETTTCPTDFERVARISKADGRNKYDMFIAWDEDDENVRRYLGHWNGGVVG